MPANANSHRTAIARRGVSAPCRWLAEQGRIVGVPLDWGCGKGADMRYLQCEGYDPYHRPKLPVGILGKFDTILCTYVLNVIPSAGDRERILQNAMARLQSGGWLYVTVRADRKNLNGPTKRGTWQGYVGPHLEMRGYTLIRKTSSYEIWGKQKS